jgi:glycosyltransferase involved in cell wall biosynthesis
MDKPTPPLVSIVTPTLNQAAYLEATIRSVLSQDYPRIEYLIVDGGSTDGSPEIIRRHQAHLSWWVSEPDQGQTAAINKGFARATGDILAWLNSDDTYEPGAVAAAANYLAENPAVGLVYANANYINAAGRVIGRFPAAPTDYRRLRRGYVHIPQQAAFFRAGLWREHGPLDASFHFAMDYDLWTRIAARSALQYLPDRTWANFRLHASGKTIAEDDRCWPEMLRVHYRDGGRPLSLMVAKYYLRRLLAPVWTWRRRQLLRRGGDRNR